MRKMQKETILGFLKKKENRDSIFSAVLAEIVLAIIGFTATIVSGLFSYLYWLSYFKRLEIPMEFCKDAIIPSTNIVVTVLPALFFGFIISIMILIIADVILVKIRHSKMLLILSEALFIILSFFALFPAATAGSDVWPGYLCMVYVIIFFTGSFWHSACVRVLSGFKFTRYAKCIGNVILCIVAFLLILYTVYVYGGFENRFTTTDWYTDIRYCAEERTLKPDQNVKIILFETDDYYYTVEGVYEVFESSADQVVIHDLNHTLVDKGSVNTYTKDLNYIIISDEEEQWKPPSNNEILFLIILIYCFIQLETLFMGWPTKMNKSKSRTKANKSRNTHK